MNYEAFVSTDVGNKRRINEDNFCSNSEMGLFVVADGMGGHAAGEVASRLAVEEIEDVIQAARFDEGWTWPDNYDPKISLMANKLKFAIHNANEKIRKATRDYNECRGMGTTIVAALIIRGKCCIAHVGDSRAYLYRNNELKPLTSDHSWVNEQLKQGFITLEHARNHPFRNVITQALGSGADIRIDTLEMDLYATDVLLLCSDGLNSMLADNEIEAIVRTGARGALDDLNHQLIEAAKEKGGDDNITVTLIRVGEFAPSER
ncbi:MAG: Stp1/IreP family PP2C-type Ser/Thr phosphatase [Acidobacteria bacterium]|nr:Stp1/IreP family PP2C-type Ser/Thr phosphatase [Acidobacteriota bacterium]